MRRIAVCVLLLILLGSLGAGGAVANEHQADAVITLIHDTHVHGNLMVGKVGLPQKMTLVNQIRQARPNALWVGNGDDLGGSLLSTVFQGKQITDAWNRLGLAVDGVGNHEFDLGPELFMARVRDSHFPWVTANVRDKRTGDAFGAEAGVRTFALIAVSGVKVGFTGLTTITAAATSSPGPDARFLDYVTAMSEVVPQMRAAGAQVIVVLAHICPDDAKRVAEQVVGIDLIVGDHCAGVLEQPEVVGQTILSRVGDEYRYVGQVDLFISNGRVSGFSFTRYTIDEQVAPEPVAAALVKAYDDKLNELFDVVIGRTTVALDARKEINRAMETPLGNLIADAFRQATGAQIGLFNAGGIRAAKVFAPGPLTKRDVASIAPFPNRLVTLRVSGATLLQVLENSLSMINKSDGRFLQVSGLTMQADLTKPVGERVRAVWVGGAPLDTAAQYTVATTDFVQGGGNGYSMLAGGPEPIVGPILMDAIIQWVQKSSLISPQTEGRIRYLAGVRLPIDRDAISFDGKPVAFDQGAVLLEGTPYVPLRAVAELFGYVVRWDQTTGAVTVLTRDDAVLMHLLRGEAPLLHDRTLVPLSWLSQLHLTAMQEGADVELRYNPPQ